MYLFLDFETTGLDPLVDRILEAAWVPTHSTTATDGTIESALATPSIVAWDLLEGNAFVANMHETSGLTDDLRYGQTLEVSDIEDRILETMHEWSTSHESCPDDQTWYLAGASVHFDLAFIKSWMPRLAAKLSHRVFDTSTLKAFFSIFLELPSGIANDAPHRAANDVLEVLEFTQFYMIMMGKAADVMYDRATEAELQAMVSGETE